MVVIYLLTHSCLFKILSDVQYWGDNHETYSCYFSHCHWRKFSWGKRILLFCSVNANLRSMTLFEHFCPNMIFSSWLIFEYLLKRHVTLILKFLNFLWLLLETWLPSMVLSQHFQIQHFLSLIDRRHFFPSYWVRHIRERQTGCRRKFNQVEVICNRFYCWNLLTKSIKL